MSQRRFPLHFLLPLLIIGAMLSTAALVACTAGSLDDGGYYGSY